MRMTRTLQSNEENARNRPSLLAMTEIANDEHEGNPCRDAERESTGCEVIEHKVQDPKKKRPPCLSQGGRSLFARRYQAGTPDSSPRNPYRHMSRYRVMREMPSSAATSVRR